MSIQVEIIGADMRDVFRMFDRLELRLWEGSLVAYMKGVMEPWLKDRATARFDAEGDEVTGKWHPLAPTTQHIRATSGYGAASPINRRTGELERYITQSSSTVATVAGGVQMTYPGTEPGGVLARKVRTAQRGHSTPQTPPRPVLGVGLADMNFYMSTLAYYIENGP